MYKSNVKKSDSMMEPGFVPPDGLGYNNMSSLYDHQMGGPMVNNLKKPAKSKTGANKRTPSNNKKFLEDIQQVMPNYSFAADPIAAAAANVTMVMPSSQLPFPPINTVANSLVLPPPPLAKKKQARPRKTATPKATKLAKSPKQTKKNGATAKAKRARKPRQMKDEMSPTANGTGGRRKKAPGTPKTPRQSKKRTPQEDQVAHFLASYGGGTSYNHVDTTTPEKSSTFVNGAASYVPPTPPPPTSVFNSMNEVELSTALILQSLSQRSFDSFHKKQSDATTPTSEQLGPSYVNYYRR